MICQKGRQHVEKVLFFALSLLSIRSLFWLPVVPTCESNVSRDAFSLLNPTRILFHKGLPPQDRKLRKKKTQFDSHGNNVLIVTNGIQPLVPNGGVSMMFTRYTDILREKNRVQVLVPYTTKASAATEEFWAERNVPLHSIPKASGEKDYGTQEMKRSFQILLWILAHENFDIIIFHDYRGIATHTIQMKMTGTQLQSTKIVVTCHSSSRYSDQLNMRKISSNDLVVYGMEDFTRTYADLTVFPSRFFYNTMQEESEMTERMKNVKIIPNFIKDASRPPPRNNSVLHSKKLAYYGRVDLLKGIEFIFRTLCSIEEGEIDEFLILGDINSDDMKSLVRRNAEYIEREKKIKFTVVGAKPMEEAMAYLRENNFVVLLASYYETYGCALQELVYFGIPVLFSDAGGFKEVVKEHRSMYEIEDTEQLKRHILRGVRHGFKILELKDDPNDSVRRFEEIIFANIESSAASIQDCSDVTVGIVTEGRNNLVTELVSVLIEKQTCTGFRILILNNNDSHISFRYETTQILRDGIMVSKARNELIHHCETTYLVLFDDDDLPLPTMLFNLKATIVNTHSHLASSPCNNIVDNNLEKVSLTSGFTNLGANMLIHHAGKATVIVDVAFMKTIGGLYEEVALERRSPFVDWSMYTKVSLNGGKVSIYPLPLYNYTKYSNSSLYYTATDSARHLGHMKVVNLYCKKLDLPPSLCSILQMVKSI